MMRMNSLRAAILAVCCVAGQGAHAQLFGDDQARQAILDLRQRFDQSVAAQNRLVDENAQMRRGMRRRGRLDGRFRFWLDSGVRTGTDKIGETT